MARMVIFDDGLGQLGPMTDLRASFEVRSGMNTTAERIAETWPRSLTGYWVPERLKAVVEERANAPVNQLPAEEELLCVNGRWGMPSTDVQVEVGEAVVEAGTGHVVIARLR
ncbi:MAG TPA: putative sugar nucleotidyl transferase, partial [Phycisphaerales bacterium]|nr:putative sugar nucleotidyl transferase [Phycisphaerales bacterium]